jgi:hypothetical protein
MVVAGIPVTLRMFGDARSARCAMEWPIAARPTARRERPPLGGHGDIRTGVAECEVGIGSWNSSS